MTRSVRTDWLIIPREARIANFQIDWERESGWEMTERLRNIPRDLALRQRSRIKLSRLHAAFRTAAAAVAVLNGALWRDFDRAADRMASGPGTRIRSSRASENTYLRNIIECRSHVETHCDEMTGRDCPSKKDKERESVKVKGKEIQEDGRSRGRETEGDGGYQRQRVMEGYGNVLSLGTHR